LSNFNLWLNETLANIGRTGHGRPIALVWMAVFLTFIIFSDLSPLKAAKLALFDGYQSLCPRKVKSDSVVIVEIDEATLGALGQWPWPRNYLAALIDAIASLKPSAIGLDIIMSEPDHASPQAIAESRPDLPKETLKILTKSASNDSLLAASFSNVPTVLGAAGFSFRTSVTFNGFKTSEILVQGGELVSWLNAYPYVLASLPEFQAAARGQALLSNNPEKGVVRRVALLTAINGTVTPGLSLEMLRVANGVNNIIANVGHQGIKAVNIANKYIPLQSNGEAWVSYDKPSRKRYISALSILKSEVPPNQVSGKMVLVGLTGLGLQDMITTPTGEQRPGVEVHAQLLESFVDNQFLLRPWWMQWIEAGILMTVGLFLIWKLPGTKVKNYSRARSNEKNQETNHSVLSRMQSDSISAFANPHLIQDRRKRARPGGKISARVVTRIVFVLFVVLFSSGLVLFNWAGMLFDSITLFVALGIILSSLFFSAVIEFEKQRKEAENALQNQRMKAAQMLGELNAARKIQLGTLPKSDNSFPGELRFQIEAMLEPAKQVGGDLYDFFLIDNKRLFFIIGDVSGKGLPASLFMVVTKALVKSAALRENDNIGTIISQANMELARENPEMLFVTGLAGLLDLDTGVLELVNAGHDAPWHINNQGHIERIEGNGGPPLGVMDEYNYPYKKVQLSIGDTLLFVTDGVYEAMNSNDELYSTDRITEVLERVGVQSTMRQLREELREDLRIFVGEAEPSDDITLLVLQWQGLALSQAK
jgi:adenylate cyclase